MTPVRAADASDGDRVGPRAQGGRQAAGRGRESMRRGLGAFGAAGERSARTLAGWRAGLCAALGASLTAGAASAAQPEPMGLGLQKPASPVMADIHFFHDWVLLPIITAISLFVLGLLIWIIVRYNAKANPVPAKFTHNTTLEIIWTAIPVAILVVISLFSFPLLYKEDQTPAKFDLTLKVTGHQWYWSYEYPDQDGLSFDSNMLTREDAQAAGKPALLAVDNATVVPVGKVVRLQITASDVIHSWAMPAMGVKMDAVPGRLNEAWFKADRVGTYYGQCSEICGIRHAFMPIELRVVTQAEFDAWVAGQQSAATSSPVQSAAVSTATLAARAN
jgi:cytochrome c oxidase subunit 2